MAGTKNTCFPVDLWRSTHAACDQARVLPRPDKFGRFDGGHEKHVVPCKWRTTRVAIVSGRACETMLDAWVGWD